MFKKEETWRFLLLYGSQTGNAEAISEDLVEQAMTRGFVAERHALNDTDKKFNLERETCAVIITSTTGEGDPPDNATKFMKRFMKRTLPNDCLSKLKIAVLGLGDSNYSDFCNCGKTLWKSLLDVGAKEFYPAGWADDATGLEIVVEPWLDGLWDSLSRTLKSSIKQNEPLSNGSTTENGCQPDKCFLDGQSKQLNGVESVSSSEFSKEKLKNIPLEKVTVANAKSVNSISNGKAVDVSDNHVASSRVCTTRGDDAPDPSSSHDSSAQITSNRTLCNCEYICRPCPDMEGKELTIPVLSPAYLHLTYDRNSSSAAATTTTSSLILNGMSLPSSASDVVIATVSKATQLTADDAVKRALEIELKFPENSFKYEPGDAFSVIYRNNPQEVENLLERLESADVADLSYSLTIDKETKKRSASLPKHLPAQSTLRYVLTTSCDIRSVPKKALLRLLVEYTSSPGEKLRLHQICCKDGQREYSTFIRQPALCLMDLLNHFKTCQPPIGRILEYLPPLLPRPYSASSSQLRSPDCVSFFFNIVDIPECDGRTYRRQGLCTGWLDNITKSVQTPYCLDDRLEQVSLETNTYIKEKIEVPIFMRSHNKFHLPDDPSIPVIMIGPGTGLAPFMGFLQHRSYLVESSGASYGKMWLLYGCRHRDKDHLHRNEVAGFHAKGLLTHLSVGYSRHDSESERKYVQDLMEETKAELVAWLDEAHVYVCGEDKATSDVFEQFVRIVAAVNNLQEKESRAYLMTKRLKHTYHDDTWT